MYIRYVILNNMTWSLKMCTVHTSDFALLWFIIDPIQMGYRFEIYLVWSTFAICLKFFIKS